MLETPTFGRYTREEKQLIFEPAKEYMSLVYFCLGGGIFGFFSGIFKQETGVLLVSIMVFLAGVWAHFSVVRITFDVSAKSYRRRQGPGFIPRLWKGNFNELDALVVIAEHSVTGIKFHLVLHWKNNRAPLMVLESDTGNAQNLLSKSYRFSKSIGVTLYDNTQFPSPCPVPIF
jgi:hypothetical protein